jgi:hypothetical protein
VASQVSEHASVELAGWDPVLSDADLKAALEEANVPQATSEAIVHEHEIVPLQALRVALAVDGGVAPLALFFAGRVLAKQPTLGTTRAPRGQTT